MKRGSGILLHISSLPSRYGIGDMGPDAYRFADLLAKNRQSFWQVLPLNPVNPGAGNSPYFSSSSFAGNPLLISPDILVQEGFLSEQDCAEIPGGVENMVDYPAVHAYKEKLLDNAYLSLKAGMGDREAFDAFCTQQAHWLDDFSLFSVLKKNYGGIIWAEWPEPLKYRDDKSLQDAHSENSDLIEKEKFIQFIFSRQWAALKKHCNDNGISIIGDMPIYVSYDSADVWVNYRLFKLNADKTPSAVSGVPPDCYSETGQLWNTPVYSWENLKQEGYRWWIQRMQAMLASFDIVRIDHFRGLVQYWEIPAGEKTAIHGAWQDVPVYDFLNTLLEYIPKSAIIAEDLGTITPNVREVMQHYGFPGMKILQFAFGEDDPHHPYLPHAFERNFLVYPGNHDNNTIRGWIEDELSEVEKTRLYRYLGRKLIPEKTVEALIRLIMMSVADVAIIPMQDILVLGSAARMNRPSESFGNWRWRMTGEQMSETVLDNIGMMTQIYGRCR